jgi:hypothetical protein
MNYTDVLNVYSMFMPPKIGGSLGLGATLLGGIKQFQDTTRTIGAAVQTISPLPPGMNITVDTNTLTTSGNGFHQTIPLNFIEQGVIQKIFLFDATQPFHQTITTPNATR